MGQNSGSNQRESEKRQSTRSGGTDKKRSKYESDKIYNDKSIKSAESSELSDYKDKKDKNSKKDKKSKKKKDDKKRGLDDYHSEEEAMDSTSNTGGGGGNTRMKSENMVFGGSGSHDQYSDGLGFSNHSGRHQGGGKRDSEGMLDDKYLRSNSIVVNDHDIMN